MEQFVGLIEQHGDTFPGGMTCEVRAVDQMPFWVESTEVCERRKTAKRRRDPSSFSTGSQQSSAENDRRMRAQDDQQHGSGDGDDIGFDPVAAMASLDLGGDGGERKKGDEMQERAISIAERGEMQQLMTRKYGSRICRLCNSPCVVKLITSDKNGNRGKWYVKCRNGYGSGHCFEILD